MTTTKKKKEEKSKWITKKPDKFDTPEFREMVRSWLDGKKDTQQREVLNPKKKKTNWITKKKNYTNQ